METWVDYALGGGSSGARTTEAGDSTESEDRSVTRGATSGVGCAAVASVAGAQDVPWQPAGAHGIGHGWAGVGLLPDEGPAGMASGQSPSASAAGAGVAMVWATTASLGGWRSPMPIMPGIVHA